MAGNCPRCDRYLGASATCPDCDVDPAWVPPPHPSWPSPAYATAEPDPPNTAPPDGRSDSFSLRGFVVEGTPIRQRFLPGTLAARWGMALTWGALVYLKAQDLVATAFWQLFWWAFPLLVVWLVLAFFAGKLGLGGCLTAGLRLNTVRGPRPRDGGWRLLVATGADAAEHVVVAGDIPVQPDHEVVVHGPMIAGVRHAWLVQGVAPTTFTRLGRGLNGTVLLALVLLPQIGWLLLR